MKVIKALFKGILVIILTAVIVVTGFFAFMVFNNGNSEGYLKKTYEVAEEDKVKVILDCDNSLGSFGDVDDGLVLSYLLSKPEAELLGVTTTFGSSTYDHKYTVNMINDAGRTDIPVMQGEQSRGDGATDAAFFLAETVAKYPGEVTIIAAGSLGNIDAASRVDGNFYNNVKEIVIMGGLTGKLYLGTMAVEEINLSADYEAAHAVINSGVKVTIMTSQACMDAPFMLKDFQKLENFPVKWKFFAVLWAAINKVETGSNYFIMWDMMPTIYVFHPEYFEDNEVYVTSGLEDLQNGYLNTVDMGGGAPINMPDGIYDIQGFYKDLFETLNRQGK